MGCWIKGRFVISRSLIDTHVQPSDELCAGALAAAETMAAAEKNLKQAYRASGLVYNKEGEAKGENGRHAIIVGEYSGGDSKKRKRLRNELRTGLKYAPKMAEAVEKVLGEAAGDVSLEDIHEATKEAGFPSVAPSKSFGPTFSARFDQFLGAVGKKLNKVGCMGSIRTKKGKRAAQGDSSGDPSLGTGGKTGAKKPGARKKARKRPPKGKTANPLDMMQ